MKPVLSALSVIFLLCCMQPVWASDAQQQFDALRRSADGGDASAQYFLAYLQLTRLEQGLSLPAADKVAAHERRYAEQAAVASAAIFTPDYKDAAQWARRSADAGNPGAMFLLAGLYLDGKGVDKDPAQMVAWLQKSADKEHAASQMTLGALYAQGQLVPKDHEKARVYLLQAAKQGEAGAHYLLGLMYKNGRGGEKDPQLAFSHIRQAAEGKYPAAMRELGICYLVGIGVKRDEKAAFQHFREAADAGEVRALVNLGNGYFHGLGVAKDVPLAIKCYTEAAEKGAVDAMTSLGDMYNTGDPLPRDYAKAFDWYQRASKLGSAVAMQRLAWYYDNGEQVKQDPQHARQLLEQAARKGDINAMAELTVRAESRDTAAGAVVAAIRKDGVTFNEKDLRQALNRRRSEPTVREARASRGAGTRRDAGAGPWPPAEASFASAGEWDRLYRSSPLLSERAFLEKVKAVRVEVLSTESATNLAGEQKLRQAAEDGLMRAGFDVDPSAPVKAQVIVRLMTATQTVSSAWSDNTVRKSERENHLLMTSLRFVVPAKVYRNGRFVQLEVAPAYTYTMTSWGGSNFGAKDLTSDLADSMPKLVRQINDSNQSKESPTWTKALWPADNVAAAYASYAQAGTGKPQDLLRYAQDLTNIGPVVTSFTGDLVHKDNMPWARKFLDENTLRAQWKDELRRLQLKADDPDSTLYISHFAWVYWRGPSNFAQGLLSNPASQFYVCINHATLQERHVVYELGGKLYRGDVTLAVEAAMDMATQETGRQITTRGANVAMNRLSNALSKAR